MKFVNSEQIASERARLDALIKKLQGDLVRLDELERLAASLTVSFEQVPTVDAVTAGDSPQKRDLPPRKPSPDLSDLNPNRNLPYTQGQVETLRAARPADLAKLAEDWGRSAGGLGKKREEILAAARREAAHQSWMTPSVDAPAVKNASDTEPVADSEIVDGRGVDTPAIDQFFEDELPVTPRSEIDKRTGQSEARIFDGAAYHEWSSLSNRTAKRGMPVPGLIDNGPQDQRILDPVAFSSRAYR